jgi:gluconate 2-dehydrogenase gamma chain
MPSFSRRGFTLAAAATMALPGADLRVFTREDALWIEAIQSHIIPTDDAPGAREAGCLAYLDLQLTQALQRFLPAYRSGLRDFQAAHPDFLTLSPAAQLSLLNQWNGKPFFEMLIDHTMQGFYGSPAHGGNRGQASWKMLGIEAYMGEGHYHGR